MTVRELIKMLLDCPMDSEILYPMDVGDHKVVVSAITSATTDEDGKHTELGSIDRSGGDEDKED